MRVVVHPALSIADYHQQCVNARRSDRQRARSAPALLRGGGRGASTRAAARLYVAQQALSREIKRLETQLGTTLFVRTTRRVTLTPDGERLFVRARDLVARHDAVWADVHCPPRNRRWSTS
jgi:DNA-binding transcriptional LysR family regulator